MNTRLKVFWWLCSPEVCSTIQPQTCHSNSNCLVIKFEDVTQRVAINDRLGTPRSGLPFRDGQTNAGRTRRSLAQETTMYSLRGTHLIPLPPLSLSIQRSLYHESKVHSGAPDTLTDRGGALINLTLKPIMAYPKLSDKLQLSPQQRPRRISTNIVPS
jgi:hypothetical protein